MSAIKQNTTKAICVLLNGKITRILSLLSQQAEISAALEGERTAAKELMKRAKLKRYITPKGQEALVVVNTTYEWSVEKLAGVLEDEVFEKLCPRKADAAKLRVLLSGKPPYSKELCKCAKAKKKSKLEVRAAKVVEAEAVK